MIIFSKDKRHSIAILRIAQDICSTVKAKGRRKYGLTNEYLVARDQYKSQNGLTDFERGFIAGRNAGINEVQRELHNTIMTIEDYK